MEQEQPRLRYEVYCPGADALKFWLMPFVCFLCFGLPESLGKVVSVLSGFAPLCFYILCGFFALTGNQESQDRRLKQGIRRSARVFALLALVCFVLNAGYYLLSGANAAALFSTLARKRVLFNFVVLSAWPFQMGNSIWFIQSLLYAYIILYILNRLRLLRSGLLLFLICVLLMYGTGELAGLIRFRFLGYGYLPPNVLTRALPYVLLGGLMRARADRMGERSPLLYLVLVPVGLGLAFLEFELLSRFGLLATTSHALGLGVTAYGLCAWVLLFSETEENFFATSGRFIARTVYALSQPVAFALVVPLSILIPAAGGMIQTLGGMAVYPVCLVLALLWGRFRPRGRRADKTIE